MSRVAATWSRARRALSPAEWRRVGLLGLVILALHVIGFGTLIALVVPQHFDLGASGIFGLGVGVTAYTLGLRHAFDADHIGAIDNTTRKLMSEGSGRSASGSSSRSATRRSSSCSRRCSRSGSRA